jgi:hypothetical protein
MFSGRSTTQLEPKVLTLLKFCDKEARMTKKRKVIAVALAIWILVAIYLASKTLDELRSNKQFSGYDEILSMKYIIFPSLRDQE